MTGVYLDDPVDPAARITELHVWILVYPNGAESIMSVDLPIGVHGEVRHTPLMSSRRNVAALAARIAQRVVADYVSIRDGGVRAELRSFRVVASSD
jgi:hypothetical protein